MQLNECSEGKLIYQIHIVKNKKSLKSITLTSTSKKLEKQKQIKFKAANKTLGAQERDNDVTEETLTEFEKGRTLWSPTLKVLISLNKESDPT